MQVFLIGCCLLACCLGFPHRMRHPAVPSSLVAYTCGTYYGTGQSHYTALRVATTPIPSSDQGRKEKNEYLDSIFNSRRSTLTSSSMHTTIHNDTTTSLMEVFPTRRQPTKTTTTTTTRTATAITSTIPKPLVRRKNAISTSYVRSINTQIDLHLPPKNTMKDNDYSSLTISANKLKNYLNANKEHIDKVHVLTVIFTSFL